MKLLPLSLVLLSLGGPLAAQAPAPTATPVPCPATASLEIGQARAAAYEMINRVPVTNDLTVSYEQPKGVYKVGITFSSDKPDAKVVALHFVFATTGKLREDIEQRYGKPDVAPSDRGPGIWNLRRCGVQLRYQMQQAPGRAVLQEEMWVEPLPGAKK